MVRQKYRYLVVQISLLGTEQGASSALDEKPKKNVNVSITAGTLFSAIRDWTLKLQGEVGLGFILSTLQVTYWNPSTSIAIVRVTRDYWRVLGATLALITKVKRWQSKMEVIHVGATIRQCQKALLRRDLLSLKPAAEEL